LLGYFVVGQNGWTCRMIDGAERRLSDRLQLDQSEMQSLVQERSAVLICSLTARWQDSVSGVFRDFLVRLLQERQFFRHP